MSKAKHNHSHIQSHGLDSVNVSFLQSDDGRSFKSLPLVISPRWESSLDFLCSWMKCNHVFVDEMMLRYGAVLFRGFDVETCADVETAVMSYQPNLSDKYRGTSPRKVMEGTEYVFSAAEVPVNYPISQHIEMSFLPAPPRQLFFSCMKASTSAGGETALADFRKVYRDLPPALRQKFFQKKLRYHRTHKKVGTYFTYDVADMLGWPQLFGTSDKDQVERICQEEGILMRWEGPNNDTFVSIIDSEPFQLHPITKEPVWFNHTQVFHWTSFPVELFYAFLRTYEIRLLIHCIFVSIFCIVKYGILGQKMGLTAMFGDETPITAAEMHQVRRVIHKHMVFNRWQKGDILCIDNYSTSHGRQPTYDKGRKVVVSWADPLVKANELTYHASLSTKQEVDHNATTSVVETELPIIQQEENPQERTPESTLTKKESQELKEAVASDMLVKAFRDLNDKDSTSNIKTTIKADFFKDIPHDNPQDMAITSNDKEATLVSIQQQQWIIKHNGNAIRTSREIEKRRIVKTRSQPSIFDSSDFWKKLE